MPKLRKALPHLGLMLYEHQVEPLLKRLRDGELDFGIMALPPRRTASKPRELYERNSRLRFRTGTRWLGAIDHQAPDLRDSAAFAEDGHCLRDQALEVCSRIDVREAEDFRATKLGNIATNGGRGSRHHAVAGNRGGIAIS